MFRVTASLGRRIALVVIALSVVFTLCAVTLQAWFAWRVQMDAMREELATLQGLSFLLNSRVKHEFGLIVLAQLGQAMLSAATIMLVVNRMVTVHVRHIAQYLEHLTPNTLSRRLMLQRRFSGRDELTSVVSAIDALQATFSEELARRHSAEQELAAHRDAFARLVGEQTAELRASNARLQALSRLDPLTGLANRRHFDEAKEVEFRRAMSLRQPLSVLLCDIDFFKRYNDAYGHVQGDRCLARVAEIMRRSFSRARALPARIGGEEFAVLLPNTCESEALTAATRLTSALEAMALPHAASDAAGHVTLSIGAAQVRSDTASFDELLQAADAALYRAKRTGRNRAVASQAP